MVVITALSDSQEPTRIVIGCDDSAALIAADLVVHGVVVLVERNVPAPPHREYDEIARARQLLALLHHIEPQGGSQ